MGNAVLLAVIPAALGLFPDGTTGGASAPVLLRTVPLGGVGGPADRTGIPGRIDHMRYDPGTKRLFVACVANNTLEAVDLERGARAGSVAGLRGPQGVAVAAGWVYVTTGGDGRLHRFDARTLAPGGSVPVGDDADNVRAVGDGKAWVSFGGAGTGGLARLDLKTLTLEKTLTLPKMPEGFQAHASGETVFANVPAGKRSAEDGTVFGLSAATGGVLWGRKLVGRAGNFPMALDPAKGRVFVATRSPARLISLDARDGSVLGEADGPPESDDLFFDPPSGLVAVAGGGSPPGEGGPGGAGASLDLFRVDGAGRPTRLGGTPLPPHSRTGALAVDRRAIYVASPMAEGRPAEVREYRVPD